MKNKKKLLVLALALVLLIAVAVSATLAYFTDSEGVKNTMTSGNIYIEQLEHKRDGTTAYEDKLDLYPSVYEKEASGGLKTDATATFANGGSMNVWGDSINGEIDKFVSVKNTGSRDAYVRTIFLFENGTYEEDYGTVGTGDDKTLYILDQLSILDSNTDGQKLVWLTEDDGQGGTRTAVFTIGGKSYSIAVATYATALVPDNAETVDTVEGISDPSLCQIHLKPTATNKWSEAVGNEYTIIAFSQGTQTMGFKEYGYTAGEALDASFGAVTKENVETWLAGLDIAA